MRKKLTISLVVLIIILSCIVVFYNRQNYFSLGSTAQIKEWFKNIHSGLIRPSNSTDTVAIGKYATNTPYRLEVSGGGAFDNAYADQFCINTTTPDCIDAWSDIGGGATGNPFDQWLDSTSSPTFKNASTTGSLFVNNDLTVSSTQELSGKMELMSSLTGSTFNGSGFLFVSDNYVYQTAIYAHTFSIVEHTNKKSPAIIGQLTDAVRLNGCEGVVVVGRYAFVTSMGSDSVSAIDVGNPEKPVIVGYLTDATLLNGVEHIAISGKYAYVAAYNDNRVTKIDISDPMNMKIMYSVTDATALKSVIYLGIKDNYIYATASSGGRFTSIEDTGSALIVKGTIYTTGAATFKIRGQYAYVTGYTGSDRLSIVDISSSTAMTVAGSIVDTVNLDTPLTVELSGDYAYVTVFGVNPGIAKINIANPTAPFLAYKYINAAFGGLDDIHIAGGYAYVSDNAGDGLHIVKLPGLKSDTVHTGNIFSDRIDVSGFALFNSSVYIRAGLDVGNRGILSLGAIAGESLYASTTLAVATTTPWAGYQLVVNGNSLTTGNATTTGTVDASQYCISGGNCISAWPAGGGGSGDGVWVITANGIYNATNTDTVVLGTNAITDVANTLEVTGDSWFSGDIVVGGYATTTLGFFTQGSGHFGGNLTVDGSATTSGHLAALGGNSDQWNTAYSWGDHSGAGYLTSALAATTYLSLSSWYGTTTDGLPEGTNNLYYTDAKVGDYIDSSSTIQTIFSNSATAYSWGNHATAGYLSLTNWFSTTTWAGGGDLLVKKNATTTGSMAIGSLLNCDTIDTDANGLLKCGTDGGGTGTGGNPFDQWLDTTSTPTFHSATTTHNFFAGGYASTSLGFFTQGNLWIGGNATTSHLAASEICLNGDCKTAWPTGGTGGGNPFNQWLDTTSTPTFLSVTTTNFYVGTQIRVATSTADSTYKLAVQGNAIFSGNIVVGGTLTVNAISVVSMNDEVILSTADAIFSTSTPDGLNHRPVGYDTSGFNKWLVFYGAVDNDISWDFIYPSKCASTSNAYLDIFITATSTYGDAVFKAFLWKQDGGDLVDSASSYDSPNIATTTFPTTARSLKKLTIPLTNRDYFYGGATGRLMLQLSGSSTTTDSYLFVKEKARFYCE
jgi:hypothetical protein